MKKHRNSPENTTVFEIDDDNRGKYVPHPLKKQPAKKSKRNVGSEPGAKDAVGLRIIGGRFHGTRLQYIGDNRVRPMKDRVREAVFNLIGPAIKGKHVVDLFGGTGALCIEAISRGAVSGTVIELHLPTAAMLRKNLESLALLGTVELRKTDAFFWAKNKDEHPRGTPWIVFCSPPYGFYVDRWDEMLGLLTDLRDSGPAESVFVIESDDRFDIAQLPFPVEAVRTRSYPPAEIAVYECGYPALSPVIDEIESPRFAIPR